MARRTRCRTCNHLGCSPRRHCVDCGHTLNAHGALRCEAMAVHADGIRSCTCKHFTDARDAHAAALTDAEDAMDRAYAGES